MFNHTYIGRFSNIYKLSICIYSTIYDYGAAIECIYGYSNGYYIDLNYSLIHWHAEHTLVMCILWQSTDTDQYSKLLWTILYNWDESLVNISLYQYPVI